MKALLDTNFLMIPGEFGVDIISELMNLGYIEMFTLDVVVNELEKLSAKGGKTSRSARIATELVKSGITVLKTSERMTETDGEMLRLARKGYVVCTQDSGLISKIRGEGLRFITMRQKKYLVETGGL